MGSQIDADLPAPVWIGRESWDASVLVMPSSCGRVSESKIASLGHVSGEFLGAVSPPPRAVIKHRPLRVYLLGLGTVGRGVYEFLRAFPDEFLITGALVRSARSHLELGVIDSLLETDVARVNRAVRESDIDVVIEMLGGLDPAFELIRQALIAGHSVVSANKQLISTRWAELSRFATGDQPSLLFSAAVGGAVPMIEQIHRLRCGRERITRIRGVINGTCNFVLERTAAGDSLDQAVRDAQQNGYAEPDPTADIEGHDAARKLDILSRLAFDAEPRRWRTQGLRDALEKSSGNVGIGRQVAELDEHGNASVEVQWLDPTDFLAGARGAENRLEVTLESGTIHRVRGLGAGRYPTATAVLADLIDIASRYQQAA